MRYHGGKWRLASWIIQHFPKHRTYVEPFGGAASVLLKKPKSYAEIYNDLDGIIVNVFRVLREPNLSQELLKRIELTPFSRTEFNQSYQSTDCPLEQARKTIIKSFMGFSSDAPTRDYKTGFRNNNFKSGNFASQDWANYPAGLSQAIERLKSVLIEEKPSLEVIQKYDSKETLFYLDPPYLPATRYLKEKTVCYRHEMDEAHHRELLKVIQSVAGMVIISGFPSKLYDSTLKDWHRVEKQAFGQAGNNKGSKKNTEVLWISPNAKKQLSLFN